MSILAKAGGKALNSLPNGKLFVIFLLSMLLNAIVLIGLIALVDRLVSSVDVFDFWLWDWIFENIILLFSSVLAYLVFPILLPLIISFFDTAIADTIEKSDYPEVPTPEPPFWPTLGQDLSFTLKAIGLNILVLPFYLLPVVNIFLYYILNGYLLGNEFFNVVAGRHMTRAEADQLRRKHRFNIILCGCGITFSATIPFLNLVAPIMGVVLMVHFFHLLKPKYKMITVGETAE